jgi:hypothetical protein
VNLLGRKIMVVLLAVASILFAQVALSAYACPMKTDVPSSAPGKMPCDDDVPSALCVMHCADQPQKANDKVSDVVPASFVPSFWMTVALPSVIGPRSIDARRACVRTSPIPLSIRNCCFRI